MLAFCAYSSDSTFLAAIPGMILTMPFRIVSGDLTPQVTDGFSKYFYALGPLAIFVLIIIINIVLYKLKKILNKKQQNDLNVELNKA